MRLPQLAHMACAFPAVRRGACQHPADRALTHVGTKLSLGELLQQAAAGGPLLAGVLIEAPEQLVRDAHHHLCHALHYVPRLVWYCRGGLVLLARLVEARSD